MYKVMLSAGEASGDLHGAGIAAALKRADDQVRLFGMGGSAMRKEGVEILYDIAEYSVMGFVEVVKNLPRLFKLRDALVEAMRREKPDVLVIIDYPDFNLRLAKCARKLNIPVFSYIPPSAWAWRKGRAKNVATLTNKIAAIFPFETEVYRQAGADITFVGNPLVDLVKPSMTREEARAFFGMRAKDPVILLLPGSRKQEISLLLPIMLESAEQIKAQCPDAQFFLAAASTISEATLQGMLKKCQAEVKLSAGHTYDLMVAADAAIAASGTVTLEAALLELPAVVLYKMAPLSYFIADLLVDLPNVSLPNIIAGKRVLPELLQSDANADKVKDEVLRLLREPPYRQSVCEELHAVREKLGASGAADRTAALILETARAEN